MEPSAATGMRWVPPRPGGLASRIGRRWRIAAVAAVIVIVAVVMLTGGHRPSMGLTGRGASVVAVAVSPDSKILAAADEIGRASCRGRGVSSGGGSALKKKKKSQKNRDKDV